jgi:hypothetical protein
MSEARVGHGAVTLDSGNVLIVGGTTGERFSGTMELYNAKTGAFEPFLLTLGTPRAHHSTTLVEGRYLVVAGGEQEASPQNPTGLVSTAEIFDLKATPPTHQTILLSHARSFHSALYVGEGRIALVGGIEDKALASTDIDMLFVQGNPRAELVGKLLFPRALQRTELVEGNSFLVIGGVNGGIAAKEIERCEFLQGDKWIHCSDTGKKLTRTRWSAETTRLKNGSVLVVGGMSFEKDPGSARAGPTRSMEIVEP